MSTKDIKAIIYDVDGTMVNSEPLHVHAWDQALQEHGYSLNRLSEHLRKTMVGRKPIVIANDMVEELHLPIVPKILLERKTDIFIELAHTDLEMMPGLLLSIQYFQDQRLTLGIGTSGQTKYINIILDRFNLRKYFKVIVTGEEVMHGKPDPELFITVARRLGYSSSECIVIEDATNGVQAAKARGFYCIGLNNTDAQQQDLSQADKVINSLEELCHSSILKIK